MSIKLQKDIEYANSILSGECKDKFRRVYANTNENLLLLFSKLDLVDKNVFSVLSSSDYLYMSYLFGAKNVDCFDINPITFRYFYLRKWLINNNIIDIGLSTYETVSKILANTILDNFDDEKESLIFWKDVLQKIGEKDFYNNPLFVSIFNPFNSFYNDKLINLSDKLALINPVFYNMNICTNPIEDINKRYDYVFLSNIIDYNRNSDNIKVLINNLLRLTNDHGKVICAHIPQILNEDFLQTLELERNNFEKTFEYSHIASDEMETIKYYQYTKK